MMSAFAQINAEHSKTVVDAFLNAETTEAFNSEISKKGNENYTALFRIKKDLTNGLLFSTLEAELLRIYQDFQLENDNIGVALTSYVLGSGYAKIKQTDSAKKFCRVCIDAQAPSRKITEGCRTNFAQSLQYENKYAEAYSCIDSAIQNLALLSKSSSLGTALLVKGNIFHYQSILDSAMSYYLKAADIFILSKDSSQLEKAYRNTAIVLSFLGDAKKSLKYRLLSLKIARDLKDHDAIGGNLLGLGNLKLDESSWDSANYYFELADSCFLITKNLRGRIWTQNNLANSAYYSGNHERAQKHFLIAKDLAIEMKDSNEISRIYSNLGWNYIELKNNPKAKEMFDYGLKIAESLESDDLLSQSYVGLSDYYIAKNDYKNALEHYAKSREYYERMMNNNRVNEVERLEEKFSASERELRISQLNEEKATVALDLSRQKNWTIGLTLGFILLFALGAFAYVQRKRQSEKRLAAQELAFGKKLLDSTVLAEENERQRIAKDLHDGLVQTLAATKMGLQSVAKSLKPKAEETAQLQSKIDMLQDATTEARNISHQLMPLALMENGLITAMEEMLAKTLNTANIEYTFEYFGMENERFAQRIEIGFYRIAQEMVNNILKHSQAKQVEIQLLKTKTHLVLHIEDDGVGFDLGDKQKRSGIGLNNMFSRASAVNGEINFEKADPKGTSANVRVPFV